MCCQLALSALPVVREFQKCSGLVLFLDGIKFNFSELNSFEFGVSSVELNENLPDTYLCVNVLCVCANICTVHWVVVHVK